MVRQEVRLTAFSHGAGCACKLAATDLADVLARLTPVDYPPEVLVSPATGDDAAVYVLPGGLGLVQTVDFFTPIVDDPFDWGRIAATNALSDVYAMGGRPVTALNLVAWPIQELSTELLAQVLEGGAHGGPRGRGQHRRRPFDPRPRAEVRHGRHRVRRNGSDRAELDDEAGDRLVLTKPLGLGIITTAIKRGLATPEQLRLAVEVMTTLNRAAAEAMTEVGVSAATDVTGFGLLGHLHIALAASGVSARIDVGTVELLPGTLELAEQGVIPGGTRSNHAFVAPSVDWGALPEAEQLVLADAQTSGGMLMAVPADRAGELLAKLEAGGTPAFEVGGVESDGEPGTLRLQGRLTR